MTTEQPVTCLLIEDNPADAMLTRWGFKETRFTLVHALDGPTGLLMAQDPSQHVDIIFLDVNMPGMDGHEVLRLLKADDRTRHIPVVMLSTSTSHNDRIKAYRGQCASYVEKPPGLEKLKELAEAMNLWWTGLVLLCNRP